MKHLIFPFLIFSFLVMVPVLSGCDTPPTSVFPSSTPWKASVVITSPSADTTVSGQVIVQVVVHDSTPNTSVGQLFLWVDGQGPVGWDGGNEIFWTDAFDATNGPHVLQVEAEIDSYNGKGSADFWSAPDTIITRN